MASGDGLIVRIRPRLSRLSQIQAQGIADLAERFGSGILDLTSRANLQIRGVTDSHHASLIEGLAKLDLVDADAATEASRNIIAAPFWTHGDDTSALATELETALEMRRPELPGKFGFAVDCGPTRVLGEASADIRIERDVTGGLMVRADGADFGHTVTRSQAVNAAMDLADWFITSGGAKAGRGRMAAHIAAIAANSQALSSAQTQPAAPSAKPSPGILPGGALVGLAFGQLSAPTLRMLADKADQLRLTPWRMIFVPGLFAMPEMDGLVTDPDDPILRVFACPGAPSCREAQSETRSLATTLAERIADGVELHVSGCSKGCAHAAPTQLTLVATQHGLFNLIRDGSARSLPVMSGLNTDTLKADRSWLGRLS